MGSPDPGERRGILWLVAGKRRAGSDAHSCACTKASRRTRVGVVSLSAPPVALPSSLYLSLSPRKQRGWGERSWPTRENPSFSAHTHVWRKYWHPQAPSSSRIPYVLVGTVADSAAGGGQAAASVVCTRLAANAGLVCVSCVCHEHEKKTDQGENCSKDTKAR